MRADQEALLRLGYLVPEFPGQTHVFFWREILALRKMGEDVLLLSTRKPSPLTCPHDFSDAAVAETHYVFPPTASNLTKGTISGRRRIIDACAYLAGLQKSGIKGAARQIGMLVSAIDLLEWSRRERIDHIHCHSCADAAHVVALARRMGGPSYSLTLHGDLDVYGTDHRSKMEGAAFICAVGSHLRDQIRQEVRISDDKLFVTCMGVDTSALSTFGRDRTYTPGTLHLATVARLNPAKGHVHALAAIKQGLKAGLNLRYTIAGGGYYRDKLVSIVDQLGLNASVSFTDTLSESEVFNLLGSADALVLPSIWSGEAWPVSVMEAMGAGLPVIASVIGATPEMISDGDDGFLVPQEDEQAILEKIVLLANDVTLRRRIGHAARRTAEDRFDVATTAGFLQARIRETSHSPVRSALI